MSNTPENGDVRVRVYRDPARGGKQWVGLVESFRHAGDWREEFRTYAHHPEGAEAKAGRVAENVIDKIGTPSHGFDVWVEAEKQRKAA